MAHYISESRLSPAQIVADAIELFGPNGWGLAVREREENCASFTGGGGHLSIFARKTDRGSEIEIETREWDYQARQFLEKV